MKNKKGKNNSNYKDGRTLKKHYCIVCKINEITYHTWLLGNKTCLHCCKIGDNNPNYKNGDTLKKYYCKECGKEISLNNALDGLGRCPSCSKVGDKNGNWNNGSSFEPYSIEFTEELREQIRKRDNYICQNCSMTEEEHLIVVGKVLSIHHIDYNKKNCEEDNLITICLSCNSRANFNKEHWQEFYTKLLINKYD
jgi:hypothetical protein